MDYDLVFHDLLTLLMSFEVFVNCGHLTESLPADLALERFQSIMSVEMLVESLLTGK